MKTEVTKEAATVEEAVDSALEELGVQQDAVEYEVLQEPGKRAFGFGSEKPAQVRVWIKAGAAEEIARATAREVLGITEAEADEADEPLGPSPSDEPVDLSDEELDQVADTAVAALKEILARFEISEPVIEEYEGDEGEIILDVVGGPAEKQRACRLLETLTVVAVASGSVATVYRVPG
jgi:spoIIIJ-associated protein